MGLYSSVIVLCFLLAPDHYLPDPGMEVERRSMIGAGLTCGKADSGSLGYKKPFFAYFYLYYNPSAALDRV